MLVYMDQKKNLKGTPVRKDSNRAMKEEKLVVDYKVRSGNVVLKRKIEYIQSSNFEQTMNPEKQVFVSGLPRCPAISKIH